MKNLRHHSQCFLRAIENSFYLKGAAEKSESDFIKKKKKALIILIIRAYSLSEDFLSSAWMWAESFSW